MSLNVGIWGTSKHSVEKILPKIMMNKKLKFFGFLSRSKKVITYNSMQFPVYNDQVSFCSSKKIDLIIIATPPALHYENCLLALKCNKNVIVEKPITTKYHETIKLCKIAHDKGLLIAEGFYYKQSLNFKNLSTLLNKTADKYHSINLKFGIPFLKRKSFRNNKTLGASSFWDIGCYPISFIADIFQINKIRIEQIKLYFDKNRNIDLRGYCLLNIKPNIRCYLEWGIGLSYVNCVEIWSEDKYINNTYFFSKPDDKSVRTEMFNAYGNIKSSLVEKNDLINLFLENICKNIFNKSFKEQLIFDIKNNAKLQNILIKNYKNHE